MRKIFNRYFFLNIFWIIILSLIPVYYTRGRLAVGGDVLIFFSSKGLSKYLYQWIPYHNGLPYPINYYPLYFLYKIAENFHWNPYQVSGIVLFVLSVLAGLGIYKLTKLICGKDGFFMLVPITFYIFSPALMNGWHYLYIYSTAPWFIYFVFKIIKAKEISLRNIIWLNVIIFFSSMDLPNPKYLFYMFVIMFTILICSIIFRLISWQLIIKSWWKIIIFFLLSAYIYLPLGHFYTQFTSVIPVKSGYKTEGRMPDYGFTTMDRIVNLHHDGVNLNTPEQYKYIYNPIIIFFSYTFIFLIIINFIVKKRDEETFRYELIFYVLILVFLFFAAGPNPPLGFFYEYAVSNYVLFAFLRTTSGAVFFLSIFYAVILGAFAQSIHKYQKQFILILLIITGFVGYPYINGEYYKNFNRVNEYTDRQAYGFIIPPIYFDLVTSIDSQKLDARYLHTRTNLNYMGTRWGYFGPSIYFFLYDNHNVPYTEIYSNLANHNIGYVFIDNSSVSDGKRFKYKTAKTIVDKSPIVLEKTDRQEFLPHFFTPKDIILTDKAVDDLYQIVDQPTYNLRSGIFINNKDIIPAMGSQNLKLQEIMPNKINDNPILEFAKIDPTKYRIRVHQAKKDFLLIFSDTFHKGWKVYVKQNSEFRIQNSELKKLDKYSIIPDNKEDQATKDDLISYIDQGWISALGDKKIDFISKNFADTIQNDNLPKGQFYETWLVQSSLERSPFGHLPGVIQIPDENHQQVNVFANSWWIETEKICNISEIATSPAAPRNDKAVCIKNPDGSYDFEMVVEYWPQRVFYIGVIISLTVLLSSIFYLTFKRLGGILRTSQ